MVNDIGKFIGGESEHSCCLQEKYRESEQALKSRLIYISAEHLVTLTNPTEKFVQLRLCRSDLSEESSQYFYVTKSRFHLWFLHIHIKDRINMFYTSH